VPKASSSAALALAGQSWVLIKTFTEKYVLSLDLNTDSESTTSIVVYTLLFIMNFDYFGRLLCCVVTK